MRQVMVLLVNLVLLAILTECSTTSNAKKESQSKVDSVFNYYFFLMDLELNPKAIDSSSIHLYDQTVIGSDTLFMIKDLPAALGFIQRISKIKIPFSDTSSEGVINQERVQAWKDWYKANRKRIKWDSRAHTPTLEN